MQDQDGQNENINFGLFLGSGKSIWHITSTKIVGNVGRLGNQQNNYEFINRTCIEALYLNSK